MEPTEQDILNELARAEQGDGWLAACEEAGRFFRATAELADALAGVLRGRDEGPILEVCAGRGELATALRRRGCNVTATDASPPPGAEHVIALDAADALRHYGPAIALGCFVPSGSGVDRAVMNCPTVRHYFVMNARLGATCGDDSLWRDRRWHPQPLAAVTDALITRHDAWLGPGDAVVRHGEAWHLQRVAQPATSMA